MNDIFGPQDEFPEGIIMPTFESIGESSPSSVRDDILDLEVADLPSLPPPTGKILPVIKDREVHNKLDGVEKERVERTSITEQLRIAVTKYEDKSSLECPICMGWTTHGRRISLEDEKNLLVCIPCTLRR